MADEEKQEVEEIQPDAAGKYPETVPWNKYVGIKEKFGRVEKELTGKVQTLEEQLKQATSTDEFNKVKQELEEATAKFQKTSEELESIKGKSLAEKRDYLKSKGISEEEVTGMSEEALTATVKVLGSYKPAPDLGGGGGGGSLPENPMELFRMAKTKTK